MRIVTGLLVIGSILLSACSTASNSEAELRAQAAALETEVAVLKAAAVPHEEAAATATAVNMQATPSPLSTPYTVQEPKAMLTPTPARVARTNGSGAYIYKSPSQAGDKIKLWPDDAQVQIVGAGWATDGQSWRLVKDSDGNTGWMLDEYLAITAVAAPPSGGSAGTAAALKKYLGENFGQPGLKTSWYDSIISVAVTDHTAVAVTNLATTESDKQKASNICSALSGYAYSNSNRGLGITRLQVYGQGKRLMVDRAGVGATCAAR